MVKRAWGNSAISLVDETRPPRWPMRRAAATTASDYNTKLHGKEMRREKVPLLSCVILRRPLTAMSVAEVPHARGGCLEPTCRQDSILPRTTPNQILENPLHCSFPLTVVFKRNSQSELNNGECDNN